MAKPSIFSKDYDRRMKRRKRNKVFIIVLLIILGGMLILFGTGIKDKIVAKLTQIKEETKQEEIKKEQKQEASKKSDEKQTKKATVKEEKKVVDKSFEIELDKNVKIKVFYDDSKKIKLIDSNKNKNILTDINPGKNKLIAYNKATQNMFLIGVDGSKKDVTNKNYTSTSGTAFQKDAILGSKPGYIWCGDPKFIDDNNIAYVSQLPWFNKTTKYVWKYDVKNNTHINIQSIQGENIKFDKITDKGLTVAADGKSVYLKADGSVTQ